MAEDILRSPDDLAQQQREASRQRLIRWRANNPDGLQAGEDVKIAPTRKGPKKS